MCRIPSKILYSLVFILAVSPILWGQEIGYQFDGNEAARAVYKIFERSCAECHDGASRSRSKGRFGTVMDFDQMRADPGLIVPGDAEDSEIYLVVIDPDPEFVMPPPDSDCPQLTEIEANLVKFWINSGAPSPSSEATLVERGEANETFSENSQTLSFALSKLHPMVIHFPIATIWLAFIAAISEALRLAKNTRTVVTWSMSLAAGIAIASVATGWLNAEFSGYADETVWNHRWSGVSVAILSAITLLFHFLRQYSEARVFQYAYWFGLVLSVISVSFASHTGGILVYGEETFFHLIR